MSASHHTNITAAPVTNSLLDEWCSGCHAAPAPDTHLASEWPNIVLRMQRLRQSKGFSPIPRKELGDIIEYLQANAKT